ncbi:TupA-like ATPgrasp [Arenibacter palladensis]|uniref:TupA-like ATPgrasp n=1 Tax=Arenibacter palladensis TaxID=237373 RepID=A0A1M5G4I8_9FLAO|nr:ATP-grasp fold amidoligase family protein [Arenibacter palladensis]SHF98636.1 TupA-like ATPgrasp [Arenibacter palladensis]
MSQRMTTRLKRILLVILRKITNDVLYIKIRYFITYKRFIKLQKPNTFFAKINWLKLYDRNPFYTRLVDKFEVREHIKEKIGSEYLIENFGVYEDTEAIDFDKLPNKFILKATHGAAWQIICEDKNKLDIAKSKKIMNKWLKSNFYEMWGEYVYKKVRPRIVCEALLSNENNQALVDYKFHCFHGEPKYIQTDRNRFKNHTLDFYDLEWSRLPFGLWFPPSENTIPRPESLDKMIELSKILSNEFKYVRVDFYFVKNKIFFGELTFYPCNGFGVFDPPSIDYEMGELLKL